MTDLSRYGPADLPGEERLIGKFVTAEPITDEKRFSELYDAFSDSEDGSIYRYLGYGPFEDEGAFRTFARRVYLAPDFFFYALVPTAGDAAVARSAAGVMALMRADTGNGVVEVGHICLAPSIQRTIAPSEAMFMLMRLAFETLGYRRFEWKCDAGNAKSRRAAERFGFTFEGIFRQHMVVKGRNRDTAWFSILDSEWPAVRGGFEAWLDSGNFDGAGRQKETLSALRGRDARKPPEVDQRL